MKRPSNQKVVNHSAEISATDDSIIPELITRSSDLIEDWEDGITGEIDNVDDRLNGLGIDESATPEQQSDGALEWSQEFEEAPPATVELADVDPWEETAIAELLGDLMENPSQHSVGTTNQPGLTLALAKALNVVDTSEFLEAVLSAIDSTTDGLGETVVLAKSAPIQNRQRGHHRKPSAQTNQRRSHQPKVHQNGQKPRQKESKVDQHSPIRRDGTHLSPLNLGQQKQSSSDRWQLLRLMLRRYSDRGLDELDALEDTAELFATTGSEELLPLLSSLVARVVVRPTLENTGTKLNAILGQHLLQAAQRAVTTLVNTEGWPALPTLAYRLGHVACRRRLLLKSLPRLLQSAAEQAAACPERVQRLSESSDRLDRGIPVGQMPLHLQVSGSLEIVIMRSQGV